MRTIDIIRPGSINAIIGPVGTLKRMLGDRNYFESRGYDLTVFSDESLHRGGAKLPPSDQEVRHTFNNTTLKWKLRHAVGAFIRNHARHFNPFAIYLMERAAKGEKMLVDYYIAQNRDVDIVQFHSNQEAYFFLKRRNNTKAKTVMFLHTDGNPHKMLLQYYPKLENTRYFRKYMEHFDWTVKRIDRICFIAKVGQKNFLSFYPERTLDNTSVILNGINDYTDEQKTIVAEIKNNETFQFKYRMCCTGTINHRKGQRYIIEALHRMPQSIVSQIHVDFLGDGSERQTLENLTEEYGLTNNIAFHGIVPNVDVYKHLAKNNIYVLMSNNEGLPISIIEAMRASMMIISTKVSGIPELVKDDYNGFLINPNTDELVSILSKIENFDIDTLGRNSRTRFENEFTFLRMEKEFCDMYDNI